MAIKEKSKQFFRKFAPVTVAKQNKTRDALLSRMDEMQVRFSAGVREIADAVQQNDEGQAKRFAAIDKEISASFEMIHDSVATTLKNQGLHNENIENLTIQLKEVQDNQKKLHQLLQKNLAESRETVFAAVFHDAIRKMDWLQERSFTPGRWAAGYPFLYALARTLDEFHPQNILELGLGQTTKMISQYAAANPQVQHRVVESDLSWLSFYTNANLIPDNTELVHLDYYFENCAGIDGVRVYQNFAEQLSDQKYDLIVVDAPFGGDMKQLSRVDVLKLIPQNLSENFVIILDDSDRSPEQRSVNLIKQKLTENEIVWKTGCYRGSKDTTLIATEDLKFLCSM